MVQLYPEIKDCFILYQTSTSHLSTRLIVEIWFALYNRCRSRVINEPLLSIIDELVEGDGGRFSLIACQLSSFKMKEYTYEYTYGIYI